MLTIKNLSKEIGKTNILENINLEINKGEVVFILGPSGAGKTTLLRCINLLENFDSGEILFKDKSTFEFSVDKLRYKIGMVFQHFNLFPNMTVLENIMLAPVKTGNKSKQESQTEALKLLEDFGLSEKFNFYPVRLSGGEKQRVAIARASIMDPELLLIDEPTSALDPAKTESIISIFKKISEKGTTMIIVTHDMEFVKKTEGRVVFMQSGKIISDTSTKDFFENFENNLFFDC